MKVTCHAKAAGARGKGSVTCTLNSVGKRALADARVRLMRGRRTFATGHVTRGRLSLRATVRLRPGDYTLVIKADPLTIRLLIRVH